MGRPATEGWLWADQLWLLCDAGRFGCLWLLGLWAQAIASSALNLGVLHLNHAFADVGACEHAGYHVSDEGLQLQVCPWSMGTAVL